MTTLILCINLNAISYLLKPSWGWNSSHEKPFLVAAMSINAVIQRWSDSLLLSITVLFFKELLRLQELHSKNFPPLNQQCSCWIYRFYSGFRPFHDRLLDKLRSFPRLERPVQMISGWLTKLMIFMVLAILTKKHYPKLFTKFVSQIVFIWLRAYYWRNSYKVHWIWAKG